MCPAGFYCPGFGNANYTNYKCPKGMYCPNGTEHATQYKCPRGTYSNQTQLEKQEDCMPCPGGYYCDEKGQTEFTKQCSAGEIFLS